MADICQVTFWLQSPNVFYDNMTTGSFFRIIYLRETDSTNDYLRKLKAETVLPICVYTDYQSGGRGQAGNVWISEAGENLLFSITFKPLQLRPGQAFFISRISALAVLDVLDQYIPNACIKWPNDLLCGNKKIGGILIENRISGEIIKTSIGGFGININQDSFPDFSPAPGATSLFLETRQSFSRQEVLHKLLSALEIRMKSLGNKFFQEIADEYNSRLLNFQKWANYKTETECFNAKILDIVDDGRMKLVLKNGQIRYFAFKEIFQFV